MMQNNQTDLPSPMPNLNATITSTRSRSESRLRSRRNSLQDVVMVGEFAASPRGIEKRVYAKVGADPDVQRRLKPKDIFFYATGHFMNDATASCWFSYLLLYLQDAQHLTPGQAGVVLLSGQLADAIATPLTGALSDRSNGIPRLKLGRRKLWLLIGSVIVLFCYYGVFGNVVQVESKGTQTMVLAIFAGLFNVGWAAVQVAHMSMVPELTDDEKQRVQLNSARHAFTVLANLTVFTTMGMILRRTSGDGKSNLEVYVKLARIVLLIGLVLTGVFLVGTPENLEVVREEIDGVEEVEAGTEEVGETTALIRGQVYRRQSKTTFIGLPEPRPLLGRPRGESVSVTQTEQGNIGPGTDNNYVQWTEEVLVDTEVNSALEWLKLKEFYQVACVYMLVRLATNVSQVYLSFYVTSVLHLSSQAIATVPLLLFAAQFVAAAGVGWINMGDRRVGLTAGGILYMIACVMMFLLQGEGKWMWVNLIVAIILLGIGATVTMVLSVSLEADLVGKNTASGAFLYGAISLTDKFASGVVIFLIQAMTPMTTTMTTIVGMVGGMVEDMGVEMMKGGKKGKKPLDPPVPPPVPSPVPVGKEMFLRSVNSLVPLAAMFLAICVVWTIRYKARTRTMSL